MDKELLKEQERFYEFIKSYEFINNNGRLDLEAFCVNLSTCFTCDNILDLSPRPKSIYDLLMYMLSEYANKDEMNLWVQTKNIIDWEPEHAYMYPNKYRTCIHVAGLVHVLPHWIYNIGHTLMEIPEPEKTGKYFEWVKRDWTFVFTFINGFHEFYYNYLKAFDKKVSSKSGYSLFEALHRAKKNDINFDKAAEIIKKRNDAQGKALLRIEQSISSGFYLEAITLSECVISNILYNYLEAKNIKPQTHNLNNLIKLSRDNLGKKFELFNELDEWRVQRNKAVHGFVESSIEDMSITQDRFLEFSKSASEKGLELCKITFEWYLSCAVNFIQTSFEPLGKSE
ncbi:MULTISPECIES: hypothetical protein [Pectobacterium]|uniref:HEPN domain-containing protein n=2 Tax=Pectobacterium TaxID=122277 RepID=A0AAP9IJA3_9GAMM|nr:MULTISPECIES: hypothetical protein [Pectobacterium]QHQ26297.1 hypothetical protein GMX10_21395 [Pectobacterium parvum]